MKTEVQFIKNGLLAGAPKSLCNDLDRLGAVFYVDEHGEMITKEEWEILRDKKKKKEYI